MKSVQRVSKHYFFLKLGLIILIDYTKNSNFKTVIKLANNTIHAKYIYIMLIIKKVIK